MPSPLHHIRISCNPNLVRSSESFWVIIDSQSQRPRLDLNKKIINQSKNFHSIKCHKIPHLRPFFTRVCNQFECIFVLVKIGIWKICKEDFNSCWFWHYGLWPFMLVQLVRFGLWNLIQIHSRTLCRVTYYYLAALCPPGCIAIKTKAKLMYHSIYETVSVQST